MARRSLALILLAFALPAFAETVHVVQPGETLSRIAARTLGHAGRAAEIARLNALSNPNLITVGQRLRIPDGATPIAGLRTVPLSPAATRVPESPEAQDMAVVDITGGLELMRAGEPREIGVGTRLRAGDSLRTSAAGRVILAGMNGERLTLGPSATVHVREASSTLADRRLILRLDEGTLRLQAPETPFLARYLIDAPTGQVSARSGDIQVSAVSAERMIVDVWDGRTSVTVPRGTRNLVVGQGAVFLTTDLPAPAVALPPPPGVSVATSARSVIAAAAASPGHTVIFELFADRDLQKRAALRTVATDVFGLATVRLEPGPGTWWLSIRSQNRDGLSSMPALPPPVVLEER